MKKNKGNLKLFENSVYVNADGTYVEDEDGVSLEIKTNSDGYKFVDDGFSLIYVAEAVLGAFKRKPVFGEDGWYVHHIDGDKSNCQLSNLTWTKVDSSVLTTAPSVFFKNIIVKKDSTLFVGKEPEKAVVKDRWLDTDVDRIWVFLTPKAVTYEPNVEFHDIEKWMSKAGYVHGVKSSYTNPVILHKDFDVTNFSSSNLEWCDAKDTRYVKYSEILKERQLDLLEKYNQGDKLPSTWPSR